MPCANCGGPLSGRYYELSCTNCGTVYVCELCGIKTGLSSSFPPIRCPNCRTGSVTWKRVGGGGRGERCPLCGGTGRWVKDPHYPPVKCHKCGGTGFI